MSLNADEDSGPEQEPDYPEVEPPPDASAGDSCTHRVPIIIVTNKG